jgi:hypothetical protein
MDQNGVEIKLKTHVILLSDPLYSNVYSNGLLYVKAQFDKYICVFAFGLRANFCLLNIGSI